MELKQIKETEQCTCYEQIVKMIKEGKQTEFVECENKAYVFGNKQKTASASLFIRFLYSKREDMKRAGKLNMFFAYCPFCGKKVE